ncbi:MAG: hypothetical protein RSB16_04740 [Raoultibacter sp.]
MGKAENEELKPVEEEASKQPVDAEEGTSDPKPAEDGAADEA